MTAVFRTRDDSPAEVALVGVGLLLPLGEGPGIPLERAALSMNELQKKNDDGSLKFDKDGNTIPLEGAELTKAAKAFAEARDIVVANVPQDEVQEALPPVDEKEKK